MPNLSSRYLLASAIVVTIACSDDPAKLDIDSGPESVPASVALGDTVSGEAIDAPGDIDQFTVHGPAGTLVVILPRRTGGGNDTLELLIGGGTPLLLTPGDTAFGMRPVERVAIPGPGTLSVTFRGHAEGPDSGTGGYEFIAHQVDSLPETHAVAFAPGDSIVDESLDHPGDIDVFRVHLTGPATGIGYTFSVDPGAVGSGEAVASLSDSATGEVFLSEAAFRGETATSPIYGLTPGTYLLRVADQGGSDGDIVGHYRLTTVGFGLGPETASDTVALGDTVSTEAIAPAEDIDRFALLGSARQNVVISFTGTGTPGDTLQLMFYPKNQPPILHLFAPTGGTPLGAQTSARLELPFTMPYEFDIRGDHVGPYSFSIVPYATTPEHVADTLVLGDTLVGESMDMPGDVDRFTLNGTPGRLLNMSYSADAGSGVFRVVVRDPVADTLVTFLQGTNPQFPSDPFHIPAGGKLEFTAAEYNSNDQTCHNAGCTGFYQYTGAYRLFVAGLDSTPEIASATLVLGDTVKNETLEPIGDVDDFTYTGAAGDTIVAVIHSISGNLRLHVVDPTNGALIGYTSVGPGETNPTAAIVLPHAGAFLVEVLGNVEHIDHGSYWLLVRAGP